MRALPIVDLSQRRKSFIRRIANPAMNNHATNNNHSRSHNADPSFELIRVPRSMDLRHFRRGRAPTADALAASKAANELEQDFLDSFKKIFTNGSSLIPLSDFSFHQFDLWFNSLCLPYKEFSRSSTLLPGNLSPTIRFSIQYSFKPSGHRICLSGLAGDKTRQTYEIICQIYDNSRVSFQMDETSQGTPDQSSTKAGNTIITADEATEVCATTMPDNVTLKALCNTEEDYDFPALTNRFQILDSFDLKTNQTRNSLSKVYPLPKYLYNTSYATNILPFRNFVYADLDIEIRVMVNGPKFGCGKLILSSFPDPVDGFDKLTCLSESMLQRDHVIIDLASNNQAVLRIPNQYRRTYVRTLTSDSSHHGIETAIYASAQLQILSPYNAVAGAPTSCPVQVFYRFVKCNFAGMSFAAEVKPQMDIVGDLISIGTTLFPEAKPLERILKRTGILHNQDKPYLGQTSCVVPQPRLNFTAGKGVSDNIPLFLNPATTVTQLGDYQNSSDPTDVLSIARIYGLESHFSWTKDHTAGTRIFDWPITPGSFGVNGDGYVDTTPCPLEYVTQMYNFWSGAIEARLDFVSNAFHVGTIQIDIVFNRQSDKEGEIASTYTKTFDLGDQKSVEFTIPYIYDTPFRRTNTTALYPQFANPTVVEVYNRLTPITSTNVTANQLATGSNLNPPYLGERSRAYVYVTVLNPLTPITAAPNSIDVLFFIRASPSYKLHSLIGSGFHTALSSESGLTRPSFGRFPRQAYAGDVLTDDPPVRQPMIPKNLHAQEGLSNPKSALLLGSKTGSKQNYNAIYYQMDSVDPTADFRTGIAFKTFHTTDIQTDIKDVMRRPFLLLRDTVPALLKDSVEIYKQPLYGHVLATVRQSYWIPCFVPSHFSGLKPFSRTQVSPFAALQTLFRHWRGSLCYTFVFKKWSTNTPIYVSYIPQTGVHVYGVQQNIVKFTEIGQNKKTFSKDEARVTDFVLYAETGLATEMCLVGVNPSISVRVPFDTNLNKAVTSKRVRDTSSNLNVISARDEVASISGHLILQKEDDVEFDCFVSAGDDFEPIDFIGTTHYKHPASLNTGDDYSQAQTATVSTRLTAVDDTVFTQGFRHGSLRSKAKGTDLQNETVHFQMESISKLFTSSAPAVAATTVAVGGTALFTRGVRSSAEKCLNSSADSAERIASVAEAMGTDIKQTLAWLTELTQSFKDKLGAVFDISNFGANTIAFLCDVILLIKNFDALTFSINIVKYISLLFNFSADKLFSFVPSLKEYVSVFFGSLVQEQHSTREPMPLAFSLFGLLAGMVGTVWGVESKFRGKKFADRYSAWTDRLTDARGLNYFSAAMHFIEFLFHTLKDAVLWVFGYVNPELAMKSYMADHSDLISSFMDNVETLTNPLNHTQLRRPETKTLLWTTSVRAAQIRKSLTLITPSVATTRLLQYCNRISKFAEDHYTTLTCCPIRYEPLVICIEGPSNVGKSTICAQLVTSLLKSININANGMNPIFTIVPGAKHWDGFVGQPCVLWDDWLNLNVPEHVQDQITQFYSLKSRAEFIPSMASLEEKGIRANPRIVVLLTNNAFPKTTLDSVCNHLDAVYRRRDVTIRCERTPDFQETDLRAFQPDQTNPHLRFKIVNSRIAKQDESDWMSYVDLEEMLKKRTQTHDEQEQKLLVKGLRNLQSDAEAASLLDDPALVLKSFGIKHKIENLPAGVYPSDIFEAEMEKLLEVLDPPPPPPAPQGFFSDVADWFSSSYDATHKKLSNTCHHCKKNALVTFAGYQDDEVDLSAHRICLSCRLTDSRCGLCHQHSSFWRVSRSTIESLLSMKKYASSRYSKYVALFNDLPRVVQVQVIMGISALMGSAWIGAPKHTTNMSNVFGVTATNAWFNTDEVHTQGPSTSEPAVIEPNSESVNPLEPEVSESIFCPFFQHGVFESLRERTSVPLSAFCLHKKMLESDWEIATWYKTWVCEIDDIECEIPCTPCDKDCYFTSGSQDERDAAWLKYQRFCEDFVLRTQDRAKLHYSRLSVSPRTLADELAYVCETPPFSRNSHIRLQWPGEDPSAPLLGTTAALKIKKSILDQIKGWVSSFPAWVKTALKLVAAGAAVIGVFIGCSKLINRFFPPHEQLISSGSYQTRHFLKNRDKIVKTGKPVKPQNHEQLKSSLLAKIQKNYFNIEIWIDGKLFVSMAACGIKNRTALMPRHYYRKLTEILLTNDNCKLVLRSAFYSNIAVTYVFCASDFVVSPSADICAFTVPKTMNTFNNLVPYMAKDKDWIGGITNKGYMLRAVSTNSPRVMLVDLKLYGICAEQRISGDGENFEALDSLSYNYSSDGACGSLVMRNDHTRPILALHFAGTHLGCVFPKGYGVLLTQDMFSDLDDGSEISDLEMELAPAEEAKILLAEKVSVQSLGTYSKAAHIPEKTKIRPSIIQEFLPPVQTRPGFLSPREKDYPHSVSPLVLGCEKHGILTTNFSTDQVNEVRDALFALKYDSMEPLIINPKRLTLREAIAGLEHDAYAPLKLNTSMGFPYSVHNTLTQKSSYIEIKRDEHGEVLDVLVSREVVEDLQRATELRQQGIRPFLPYIDELKDERRKLEKRLKPGSTRVFCMSSILTSIPTRQNFLHFAAAYSYNRISNLAHAVGLSSDGPEWSQLAHHLHEVSDNIVTMDYSNFGPGYNAMVNAAGHDIITKWTLANVAGVDENEMAVLGEEHYNSLHLMCDLVYKQLSGGPSGDALTVVKNGLVNEMYVLLAWKALVGDWCIQNGFSIFPAFYELTRLITYGDDLIMSVDDSIKEMFNGVTIKNFFAQYNITATDAAKTGEDIPFTTLENASFLKRGFAKHPLFQGEWLGPLEETSIEETAKWINQCPNHDDATRENAEQSLRLSYGHGPQYFNQWRETLNACLKQAELKPIYITWDEIDRNFFSARYEQHQP